MQEQIEQVDRRHQQAVSVRPLWLWVDTSTQALQYPFSRDFRAAIYIDPCRIPMNSIISFRVCAESCIHRGVRYAAIISSVGSLTIACLLQGKGSQQSRGTCMHMHAEYQTVAGDGCRRKRSVCSGMCIVHCMESSMVDITLFAYAEIWLMLMLMLMLKYCERKTLFYG